MTNGPRRRFGAVMALPLLTSGLPTNPLPGDPPATGLQPIPLPAETNFVLSEPPDPSSLTVTAAGKQFVFPLHGGAKAHIIVDPDNSVSSDAPRGFVAVDEISIAGESVTLRIGGFTVDTGTTCAAENPADPSTGTVTLEPDPFTSNPTIARADFHFSSLATSTLIQNTLPEGEVALAGDVTDAPVQIDVAKLRAGSVDGAIKTPVRISGNLPADIPLLGGAPFVLKSTLESSTHPSSHPLLAECAAFFAKVRGESARAPTPPATAGPAMAAATR